ncbi:HNH endonuclease signature motif containing protein, partial [Nocardia stercoris]
MTSTGVEDTGQAAATLLSTVTALIELPLTPLSDDAMWQAMRDIETAYWKLAAVQDRMLIEAAERSFPETCGVRGEKRMLTDVFRLSGAEAHGRVKRAFDVGCYRASSGAEREPQLPAASAAFRDGEISPTHVREISKVMHRLPGGVETEERCTAEQLLVEHARMAGPDDISKIGDRLIAYLDPDGTLSSDTDRNRRRGITIGRQGTDGLSPISGLITPQLRAFLDPLLGKYSRPGVANPDDAASSFTDPDTVDPETLRAAAERDDRTAPQRTHDAIRALLEWGIVTDRLGSHRGLPITCILTINVEDVENETGVANTATGGTVPIKDALALAERSRPFLAVFDHSGLPLHMGRTKRLASPAQRLALTASLRGCTRPGCDAPASMCAVHHVSEWADGGSTDIENLVLACDHCHARV